MPSPNKTQSQDSRDLTNSRNRLTKSPHIGQNKASFSLSHFHIDGIKQGSLSHLSFRPNSGLHPIDAVDFDKQTLNLSYEQEIKPVNRNLKIQEIQNLIQQLKHAQRSVVLGHEFYLYPSATAFILNQKNELKVLLRNIHPNQEPEVKSPHQYTVRAVLDLIKQHQPNSWTLVEKKLPSINTLEDLYQIIHSKSFLKTVGRLTWTLFISLILLFILSLPIAAYGPSQLSEPLKKIYYPFFLSFSQQLTPTSGAAKPSTTQNHDDDKANTK